VHGADVHILDPEQLRDLRRHRSREDGSAGARLQYRAFGKNDQFIGQERGLFGVVRYENGCETGLSLETAKLSTQFKSYRYV